MKVIVDGIGLAGLTCAKLLNERGAEVAVFEASDGEYAEDSCINGSMLSGEKAAQEVLG